MKSIWTRSLLVRQFSAHWKLWCYRCTQISRSIATPWSGVVCVHLCGRMRRFTQTENNNNLTSLKTNLKHSTQHHKEKKRKKNGKTSTQTFRTENSVLCFISACFSRFFSFSVFSCCNSNTVERSLHSSISVLTRVYSLCISFLFSSRCFFCVCVPFWFCRRCRRRRWCRAWDVQNRKIPRCLFEINNTYC